MTMIAFVRRAIAANHHDHDIYVAITGGYLLACNRDAVRTRHRRVSSAPG
jgi:hypothetical protein